MVLGYSKEEDIEADKKAHAKIWVDDGGKLSLVRIWARIEKERVLKG